MKTVEVRQAGSTAQRFSGTLRGRHEVPQAFQIAGAADPAFTVRAMVVLSPGQEQPPEVLQNPVLERLEKRIQEVAYFDTIETTIRPGQGVMLIRFKDFTPGERVPGT